MMDSSFQEILLVQQRSADYNEASDPNPPPPPATPPPSKRRIFDKEGRKRGRGTPTRSPVSPTISHGDIDDCSTKSGGLSWENRIPWLRNNNIAHASFESNANVYYGDVMNMYSTQEALTPPRVARIISKTASEPKSSLNPRNNNGIWSKVSNLSKGGSTRADDFTVETFTDDEWTPQDSAYGAACPVCGCLPKHIRRGIEVTLIGILIFLLVYLVVTTSIRINNEHASSGTANKSGKALRDDDYFVENGSQSEETSATVVVTGDDGGTDDDTFENKVDDSMVNEDNSGRLLLRRALLSNVQEWI